jgi:homoaconitase/3-isopropylmalate dehydratase large subunit
MATVNEGPKTHFERIWSAHRIYERADGATLLHIDRHFIRDGASMAFKELRERGLTVRRADGTFATPNHCGATRGRSFCLQAREIMFNAYGERLRPRPLLKQRVRAGLVGGRDASSWKK